MEGIRPEKALVFLRSLFLPGVSESPGFRTGWPQAGGQRPPGLQRAPGAVEQPAPGRGRGCAVMIDLLSCAEGCAEALKQWGAPLAYLCVFEWSSSVQVLSGTTTIC